MSWAWTSSSRRRIAWLTAGWERCRLSAAREKLPSWARLMRTSSSARSIVFNYTSVPSQYVGRGRFAGGAQSASASGWPKSVSQPNWVVSGKVDSTAP